MVIRILSDIVEWQLRCLRARTASKGKSFFPSLLAVQKYTPSLQSFQRAITVSIFIRRETYGVRVVRGHVTIFIWGQKPSTADLLHQKVHAIQVI
jgi:hypothetical protein